MKITVLDVHDRNYHDLFSLVEMNRQTYCAQHGYDFRIHFVNDADLGGRQPNWGRILGIREYLAECDWLFYLDTDALFMNFAVPLTTYLDGVPDQCNLLIGPNPGEGHLSSAAMLLRNCPWSFALLDDWWQQTQFIHKPYIMTGAHDWRMKGAGGFYLEQSALHYLYDVRPYCRDGTVKLTPRKWFNSLSNRTYQKGDLLVHCCGGTRKQKLAWLNQYRGELYE